jgi:predicted nucleic acid-binding Zn finger protein
MARIAEDRIEDEAVARAIRAQIEYPDFFFLIFPDGVHCVSFNSGKEYLIVERENDTTCSCDDFQYRAGPAGIRCKHICAMEMARAAGEVN